jgi:O-acetylhomoserine/O-acetylserine sulfhydrylase-like pyridoxal-dependent enzyme
MEYELTKNKTLVVKKNWAAIKENGKLHTKHIFISDLENEPEITVIDSETVSLRTAHDTITLIISGTAITVL